MSEQPNSAIARIFTIHGAIAGAGFLISERHLFTCAHVVAAALGVESDVAEAPEGEITLDFPLVAPNEKRQARVVAWNPLHDKVTPTGTEDVAVLELTENLPPTVQAALLREPKNLAEHDWKAFGFPIRYDKGVWAQGKFSGSRVGGWIQLDGSQDRPYSVAKGFSGGPIWDNQQQAIVGMVALAEKSRERPAAFMIPTTLLAEAWPAIKSNPISKRDPYVGLRTFQEEDAEWFFGRRGLTKLLVRKIEQSAFLTVLGPSGSGKSSVVLAGLVPALKKGGLHGSDKWEYLIIKPTDRPLDALAAALNHLEGGDWDTLSAWRQRLSSNERALLLAADMRRAAGKPRLVLVVDQFEELWTLAPTSASAMTLFIEQKQQPFMRLLLTSIAEQAKTSSPHLTIILTMRADFLHRAAEDRDLARLIGEHDVIVSPMQDEELREAILEPATKAGANFEAGLVDKLVEQTSKQKGALPLLQYTLAELWQAASPKQIGILTITWDAFRTLGGHISGALAKRADTILQEAYKSTDSQNELRHLLLRLVQPGEGAADTRRRAFLQDLVPAGSDSLKVQQLLKPLVDGRLLTTGHDPITEQEIIEVSHEALIRAWPTLSKWIDDAREDLRFHLQLSEAAKEWQNHEENSGYLWGDLRLANAQEWLKRTQSRLNERDERFLQASREAEAARVAREKKAQREREQLLEARASAETRNASRLRTFLAVVTVLLLIALVAAGFAFERQQQATIAATQEALARQDAEEQANRAEVAAVQEANAKGTAVAEAARAVSAEKRALAETTRAVRAESTAQAEATRAVSEARIAQAQALAAQALVELTNDPDHALLLALAAIRLDVKPPQLVVSRALRNTVETTLIREVFATGHTELVSSVAFSPSGKKVLRGSDRGTVRLWDAQTGQLLQTLRGHTGGVWSVALNSSGEKVLTGSHDGTVRLWNAQTGKLLYTLQENSFFAESVTFSPSGDMVAMGLDDGTVRLWDAQTGQLLRILKGPRSQISSLAFSPSGDKILTGSFDGAARLWNSQTGTLFHVLKGHMDHVTSVAFNSSGKKVLTSSGSFAHLWDVQTGQLLHVLKGHTDNVKSVAFNPSGEKVLTGSDDGTARLWDTVSGQLIHILGGHTDNVFTSVAFSFSEEKLLTGSADGTVRLWDAQTGRLIQTLQGHTSRVESVTFSPSGKKVLTTSNSDTRLWDIRTDIERHTLQEHTDKVIEVEISPSGKKIITISGFEARLWDTRTSQLLQTLQGHTDKVREVEFSPRGEKVLTGSDDGTARLWNTQTGQQIHTLQMDNAQKLLVALSPNGDLIATSGVFQTHLWDTQTGKRIHILQGHMSDVISVTFSASGELIATASVFKAYLWDTQTGQVAQTLQLPDTYVGIMPGSVVFSPSEKLVATSCRLSVCLWDAQTGRLFHALQDGYTGFVKSVAFSPSGEEVLMLNHSFEARLWDPQTGQLIHTLQGHRDSVMSGVFSPSGDKVLTGSMDKTARLWDPQTGKVIDSLEGHTSDVTSVAFSPSGELVATGSNDGTARLWIADHNLLIAKLTSLVCSVWGHDEEAISAEIPDWRGCKVELEAVAEDLARYNELRGE